MLHILTNPVYAGAYAFGRTETRVRIEAGRKRVVRGHRRDREHWQVLINEHHEGYIDWHTYEHNQRVIADNTNMRGGMARGALRGRGAAGRAAALRPLRAQAACGLQRQRRQPEPLSLPRCGDQPRLGARASPSARCASIRRRRRGPAVLRPVGVEAALHAIEQHATTTMPSAGSSNSRSSRHASRPRGHSASSTPSTRQPTGRRRTRAALERSGWPRSRSVRPSSSTGRPAGPDHDAQQREALLALGADLQRAWDHPAAGNESRKRILRAVIKEIVARVADARIELIIHWQGGDHTELSVVKNRTGQHRWTTDIEVQTLITQLARQLNDSSIASLLNRLGHRTGKGHTWTETRVRSFRCSHHRRLQGRRARGARRAHAGAGGRAAGTSKMTVLRMISAGTIAGLTGLQGRAVGHQAQRSATSRRLRAASSPGSGPLTEDPNKFPFNFNDVVR